MIKNKLHQLLTSSNGSSGQTRFFFSAIVVNDEYYKRLCYAQT